MALPPIVEKPQRERLLKITRANSKMPERDVCLFYFFFTTGLTTLQINRIQIGDVLKKNGKLTDSFPVRGDDEGRTGYLSNKELCKALTAYLEYLSNKMYRPGPHPDYYLGLDPDDALFITDKYKPYGICKKKTDAGNISYSSDALNRAYKRMMTEAGIEDASILSGRRTFATELRRMGVDVATIHKMLNNKQLSTTQKLLRSDTVNMGKILSDAF